MLTSVELLEILARYEAVYPEDRTRVETIRAFICAHEDCLLRSCLEGHITAAAWIVSTDARKALLVHHRKLGLWLQPGGHADGDPLPHRVALREAEEETGLSGLELWRRDGELLPLDVDVHAIPGTPAEPAHDHLDLRYLVIASPDRPLLVSEESHAVRWFDYEELESVSGEESLLRMARRAVRLLRPGRDPGPRPAPRRA
jgi:8-oxo-dGTP pyrophosphatase MutT (NUDIX family)